VCSAQRELKKLEPRLSFSLKLPTSVLLSWVSSERQPPSVKREWRDVVGTAKALGMYDVKVVTPALGHGEETV
jgi:hypothetical protein